MTNTTDAEAAKARADAAFESRQLLDADRTAAEVAKAAEAEKTARLRALRLAKEQSDRIARDVRRARRQR